MRGSLSLFTKATDLENYRTGIFVATAEPDVMAKALRGLQEQFPQITFTFLVSRYYAGLFPWIVEILESAEVLWIEQVKANPIRWLRALRERKFDLCMVLWPDRPTFRMSKFAAFSLNARTMIAYDENGDLFVLDRTNWKYMLSCCRSCLRRWTPGGLLYPFGFVYLLGRTLWLTARGRLLARKAEMERRA